jgi:hypothetical protein
VNQKKQGIISQPESVEVSGSCLCYKIAFTSWPAGKTLEITKETGIQSFNAYMNLH